MSVCAWASVRVLGLRRSRLIETTRVDSGFALAICLRYTSPYPYHPQKLMKHRTPKQSLAKTYQAVFASNAKMLLTLTTHTHLAGNDGVREMSR